MPKIRFTKRALEALPPAPAGKRIFYYSDETKGLALQVTSTGSKTFYLYRKVNGKPERIHLGIFPETTIDQAGRKADELNGAIAKGDDPLAMAGPRRGEWTMGDLWAWYLEQHAKPHKKTWKQDEYHWGNHLAQFEGTRMSALARVDIRQLHKRVGDETGQYSANKVLYLLRVMYNLAGDHELYDGSNPAMGIRPFKEKARRRRMSPEELKRFFVELAADRDQDAKDWILMALFTGQRKGNVLAMRWDEIDWRRKEWCIPETKNGEPQTVPLEPVELAILTSRMGNGSPWVFPGRTGTTTGHLVDGRKPWVRILARAGIEDFHVHDLRRTHGSALADAGASLPNIGAALGHKDAASTKVYTHLDVSAVRAAKARMLAEMPQSPAAGPD